MRLDSMSSNTDIVQLLLRLEKYPHRMNFHRGILELRKQHYKHLEKLLVKYHRCRLHEDAYMCSQKAVALNTPTEIELTLGKTIRVTLLEVGILCLHYRCADSNQANHCVGAVMFLIENEINAILYTGDIRCELHVVLV